MSQAIRNRPIPSPRRLAAAASALAVAVLCLAIPPGGAAAKKPECKRLGVGVSVSKDPTELRDDPVAALTANGRRAAIKPKVVIKRGGRVFANGRLSGRLPRGRATALPLHVRRAPGAGRYKLQLTARRAGCRHRTTVSRAFRFRTPSLPLRAAPFSTRTGDNVGGARLVLRPVAHTRIGPVRVTLENKGGAVVAEQAVSDLDDGPTILTLPLLAPLRPGEYKLRLVGQPSGSERWQSATQDLAFAEGGAMANPITITGVQTQKVTVDWYDGDYKGRELGGFVAPGIGYGEVLCTPDAQWIRFYPADEGREVSMMNWTYRDWGENREKALREALHTAGTGPDFREGLNKFGPAEKRSTGEFDGIITDRGPIDGPGGGALAPPTSLQLTWQWDFSKPASSRCHVEGTFKTQTALDDPPIARSVQVVWRGDANAPGRSESSVDFPGLGRVKVTCEAGAGGVRRLDVDSPVGGRVTTRQGSEDGTVVQGSGPIAANLPNNGMVVVELDSGQRIVVSSRWKANDPDAAANWCAVAAQVLSG